MERLPSYIVEWTKSMDIFMYAAIFVLFIGSFTIMFGVLSLLQKGWGKFLSTKEDRANLKCQIRKEGFEVFIDVKNKNWFVDILKLRFIFRFLDVERQLTSYSFEWVQGSNRKGEVFIGKRKTKAIHFATINQLEKAYDMHFLEEDLNNPFNNDNSFQIFMEGLTSSGAKKYSKMDFTAILLLIESVSKGVLDFEIGRYYEMHEE